MLALQQLQNVGEAEAEEVRTAQTVAVAASSSFKPRPSLGHPARAAAQLQGPAATATSIPSGGREEASLRWRRYSNGLYSNGGREEADFGGAADPDTARLLLVDRQVILQHRSDNQNPVGRQSSAAVGLGIWPAAVDLGPGPAAVGWTLTHTLVRYGRRLGAARSLESNTRGTGVISSAQHHREDGPTLSHGRVSMGRE